MSCEAAGSGGRCTSACLQPANSCRGPAPWSPATSSAALQHTARGMMPLCCKYTTVIHNELGVYSCSCNTKEVRESQQVHGKYTTVLPRSYFVVAGHPIALSQSVANPSPQFRLTDSIINCRAINHNLLACHGQRIRQQCKQCH